MPTQTRSLPPLSRAPGRSPPRRSHYSIAPTPSSARHSTATRDHIGIVPQESEKGTAAAAATTTTTNPQNKKMSAYARSSVLPPARGVHRFGQRRSKDRSESGGNGILPADPTAPSSIQIREEYPFSQITMSQGSASFVDESVVESTAATNRRSGDKRGNDAVLHDRAARWRLTRRELERGGVGGQKQRSTPSNDKIPMGIAKATPGRRDKRSRISLNEMTRLAGTAINIDDTIQKGSVSQSRRFLSSATKVPPVPPRSTLARGMSVLGRVMTPLRTFHRPSLLLSRTNNAVDTTTAKPRGRTMNEPSPLDRPKPTLWNRENKDGSDDATKTSCSTYDPNPPRRSMMTTVDSNSKETTMEDAITTEIAEGPSSNETNKQDGETYLIQIKEMLSQIQQTKCDVEEWKRGMEEQRIALETRYQNGFERQQQEEELDALKINVMEELKTYRDEIIEERKALDDQKAQLSEFQSTIREEMRELKVVVASSNRSHDLSRVEDAKVDAIAELRQFVEESKARIGVCGKLEMEALEGESRAVKKAICEIVDGAKNDIELKSREVVEEVKARWTDFKMHIDTFTLQTLEKTEKEEATDASVENSPSKENDKSANAKSPVKLTTSSPESSRETATASANGTAEESNEDDSTYDDDGSLLNNSSLAPVPLKRNSIGKKAPTKAATSVHSIRTAPRDTAMSVSTTPFSRKATPRIQNSFTQRQRKPTKCEGPSRKSTHSNVAEFALSVVVNGKKTKAASEISSPRGTDKNSAKAISDTDKTAPLVESKKAVSSNKETKNPIQTGPAKGNKRSRSDFDTIKSPRRSKRVREAARVEQKQALEAAVSQNSTASRNVTPKDGDMTSPPIARRRTTYGKSPSPAVSFQSNAKTPSSNGTDARNDRLLGKSVVVMADRHQEIGGLDGCESIVPKDDVLAGPLSVPWGVRGSGCSKSRKKSYSIGRKRDRKPFPFDAIGSIFEFKF